MPHSELDQVLYSQPMAASLARYADRLKQFIHALSDAHKAPGLSPEARREIVDAAKSVDDARHKLLKAAKILHG